MPFEFVPLEIKDVILIQPRIFNDNRGFFFESYKYSDFQKAGIEYQFVQDNHSKSSKGVLRGLHYQLEPKSQGKLVRVLSGSIFDVAVDIRINSPTYGKWVGEILSEKNKYMFWIPSGFAHGFIALEDGTQIHYKTTSEYSKEHERCIIWNDHEINIKWKMNEPIISEKDMEGLPLIKVENNFTF